jgi:hypothetical protein
VLRAKADIIEEDDGKIRIEVREIPFMVNKTRLIEQIAQLVREKKITDITALRDESDREGMRILMELKRDSIPEIVLNQIYKHTQAQTTFGVILLALVDGVPRVMSLREMLLHFIDHRHEVVVRRSEFDLRKARLMAQGWEGRRKAVAPGLRSAGTGELGNVRGGAARMLGAATARAGQSQPFALAICTASAAGSILSKAISSSPSTRGEGSVST